MFGNSALYEIIHGNVAFAEEAMAHPERGFYNLLAQYPAFTFSASVATITGLLFYVTSADSGALVLGNFTSKLKDINSDAPNWLRIFWSVAIGLLTIGMLMTNGISALQNTTVIMGLPFSFVIFFVMAGLYKSLKVEDYRRESASRDTAPRPARRAGSVELEEASVAVDELSGNPLYAPDDGDGVLPGNGGGGAGA
ncbi:Glycine betaine transporter BetP [Raoultella planticola]|uniref:Glycine betaine transporter BetP n=1 Tax=Raoultella planticola TaxID=575 RepID=A0A485ALV9_RAOPL|nr:Glycine betaine transporter BetP [Raoultella planticola]